jgi:hypothetical protein
LFLRFLAIVLLTLRLPAAGLGLLTAHGSVRVNGFRIWDNATILENMAVETDLVCARITLGSGPEILLAPATRIRLAHGTLTLETGSALVRRPGALIVHAPILTHDATGAALAGPGAASIPQIFDKMTEQRPLSQRP